MSKKKRIEEEAEKAKAVETAAEPEVKAEKKKTEKPKVAASEKTSEAKAEKKPRAEKKSEKASTGEPYERKLKTMTTAELTGALYEFSTKVFVWEDKVNGKLEDHEARLKKLEAKPEAGVSTEPEPPKAETGGVRPLVRNEESNRFPYPDGPNDRLWYWFKWDEKGQEWVRCGPVASVFAAERLSGLVPERAYVYVTNGKVRDLTDAEVQKYFGHPRF